MTKPDTNSDAPVDALTLPVELIRWKGDAPRPKTRKRWPYVLAAGLVLGVAIPAAARPELGAVPRLAPAGCVFHTVVPGDTVWAIAGKAGVTLDVVAKLNAHIPKLNVIRPNDQVATSCPSNEVQILDPKVVTRDELQAATVTPSAGNTETCFRGDNRAAYVCYTWPAIVTALFNNGARGEQLVTLAAIVPGESGRAVEPCTTTSECDRTIQTDVWGESSGAWQIRTLKADTGKGTTRDIARTKTLDGGAKSAVELWNQSVERGKPGGQPWTCFLLGNERPFMEIARATATALGMLR